MTAARQVLVRDVRRRLRRDGYPRLQMALMVLISGGMALLFSMLLLDAGVRAMAIRYPLAIAGGYLVFLGLLWAWLRTRLDDWAGDIPTGSGDRSAECRTDPDGAEADGVDVSGLADGLSGVDEAALPLFLLAMATAVALAAAWAVWIAPTLLAEIMIDGMVSASLYRRMKGVDPRHWLETAVRLTAVPVAGILVSATAVGVILQVLYPEVHTIGDIFRLAGTVAP